MYIILFYTGSIDSVRSSALQVYHVSDIGVSKLQALLSTSFTPLRLYRCRNKDACSQIECGLSIVN